MSLPAFFAAMRPMLLGERSATDVQTELGDAPSGTDNLEFYRVLVERNLFKILRDLYGPVRHLALRADDGTWARLVRTFAKAHPPAHHDPNRFGEGFSEFLANERARHGSIPALWEELADFCWIRHRAHVAPDLDGDGFDVRLFVRHYTHDVVEVARRLGDDADAELPGAAPKLLVLYRHARTDQVRLYFPTAAGLAALARRQGEDLPEAFAAIGTEQVDAATLHLVEHGILSSKGPTP
jgi:hypothetical protein